MKIYSFELKYLPLLQSNLMSRNVGGYVVGGGGGGVGVGGGEGGVGVGGGGEGGDGGVGGLGHIEISLSKLHVYWSNWAH